MSDWSTDTWLLLGVVLAGVISAAIAAFALYRQMWRSKRDRMWRRIDILSAPLDNWTNQIVVRDPTWIFSTYDGDMALIPTSVHDQAIENTLPMDLISEVKDFFETRASYARESNSLRKSIAKSARRRYELEIAFPEDPKIETWLTPRFVDSLYGGLYAQVAFEPFNKPEYLDGNRYGTERRTLVPIVSIQLRWVNGPMASGPWQAPIVEYFDPNRDDADVSVPDHLRPIAESHESLLADYDDETAKNSMSSLVAQYGQLSGKARHIHAQIADFRAH